MKKKLITLLLCTMLISTAGCSSAENAPAPAQTTESDTTTETELSDANDPNTTEQTEEQATETVSDTVSSKDKTSSETEEASEVSPSKEAEASNDKEEAEAKSTPTASPETEPSISPSPSPTPSFEVERWEEEKTMYAKAPVNIRKGPSKDYELCGYLGGSEAVIVRGTGDTGWYLISLGEEEGFVSNHYLLDTPPAPTPAPAEPPAAPAAPAQPVTPQEPAPAPVAPPTPAPTAAPPKVVASTIFVGDSRFVQMHEAVGETGVTWICENSKGYKWFEENAVPRIDNLVGKGTKILINLGVNDPEHHYSYINLVNGKAAEWTQKGATVYYASVNPVWDNPYTTKEEVITFNSKVSAGLVGVHWIDSYTFLNENGYRIVDGLHYAPETSAVLYNYYITCIQ